MGYPSKIILSIILLWATLSVAQTSIIEYPDWFLYPAQYPNITTGFSSPDTTSKQNAAKMKAVFNSCIVKGELYLYEVTNDYDLNKYSNYYYYYSDSTARDYYSKFKSVDKSIINILNNEYIEAFTMDTVNNIEFNYIDINTLPKPDWINKSFYEQNEYYYSIGIYTSIGRDSDAWITSEERAMFIFHDILALKEWW